MDTQFIVSTSIILLTFALYIGIAVYNKAKATSDFYVAGRGVPPIFNGMAIGADWMSAASFIGLAGTVMILGYDGLAYIMGWTGGYLLLTFLLAPQLRKYGRYTVPEFIGDRYNSHTARVIAAICTIIISFTYSIGQLSGSGVVIGRSIRNRCQGRYDDRGRPHCLLCCVRGDEGDHVDPGGSVYRVNHCVFDPGHLHVPANYREPCPVDIVR